MSSSMVSGITLDTIDMDQLRRQFKIHCPDYMEDLDPKSNSLATEFCSIVLDEIEPASRKIKRGTGNVSWKMIFHVSGEEHVVWIVSNEREAENYLPRSNGPSMVLSVKKAGLLAQETFSRLIELGCRSGKKLMTPLALACFPKHNIAKLAEELKMTEVVLLQTINQSMFCYGHHLPMADVNIAICSYFTFTRNFSDQNMKKRQYNKLVRQFMDNGKMPSHDRIAIISRYTTQDVPVVLVWELFKILNNSN